MRKKVREPHTSPAQSSTSAEPCKCGAPPWPPPHPSSACSARCGALWIEIVTVAPPTGKKALRIVGGAGTRYRVDPGRNGPLQRNQTDPLLLTVSTVICP